MNDTEPTGKTGSEPAARTRPEHLVIRISRYSGLIDLVSKHSNIFAATVLITVLVSVLFTGLTLVAIAIKRVYPYNVIQTNALGAMTIRNEEKDITYWLFNTAELWADSGVDVEKGDVLTIRASGGSHTSIHHLIEGARMNERRIGWKQSDGSDADFDERDELRRQWRIVPHKPGDALIMRVVDKEEDRTKTDPKRIYLIGKERANLYVAQAGRLEFAVNDIILSPATIYEMMSDHLRVLARKHAPNLIRRIPQVEVADQKHVEQFFTELGHDNGLKWLYDKYMDEGYRIGRHPDGTNRIDRNELTYYNEEEYVNAWYDDNVGSFLISIEHRKGNR